MKRSTILFLFFLFSIQFIIGQTCLDGITNFNTQEQIDSIAILYPDCVEILGDINIFDVAPGVITNLNGFEQITHINGRLTIAGNPDLNDLSGLVNLSSVGEYLRITGNAGLLDLSGMTNLATVNDYVRISSNSNLINLDGLQGLTFIGGDFIISENSALNAVTGIENLNQINGSLVINSCDELISFEGMNQLTSIGGELYISGNFYLEDVSGLESLTYFERLRLYFNSNLSNITALSNVTNIGGSIWIYQNDKLASLSGLDNIDYLDIDSLVILDCDLLSTCHVESVCNYLESGSTSNNIFVNAAGCNTSDEVLEFCNTVSVDPQLSDEAIFLQPNPTHDKVHLETTIQTDIYYEVYNAHGKMLLTGFKKTIDLSIYPNGIYFIKMINQNRQWVKKVYKM